MSSKFIPTLQTGNGYTHLKLKGILDEDNLLINLLSQIQGKLLLIDMSEIERINSCGVRDWVNWLNQVQALGITVILLRCSPTVVSQANMVANFAADAFIHSFYAPYVHPDTGEEQNKLILTEDIRSIKPVKAPKFHDEKGVELEFDEFEDSYFAFINDPRILNYQLSGDIRAIIQRFMPELSVMPSMTGMGPNHSAVSPVEPSMLKPAQPLRHEQPPLPEASYQPAPTSLPSSSNNNASSPFTDDLLEAASTQSIEQPQNLPQDNSPAAQNVIPIQPQEKSVPQPQANVVPQVQENSAHPAQSSAVPDVSSDNIAASQHSLPLVADDRDKKKKIIIVSGCILLALLIILLIVIFTRN